MVVDRVANLYYAIREPVSETVGVEYGHCGVDVGLKLHEAFDGV